jgi:ubiquinone biosynthesis protein
MVGLLDDATREELTDLFVSISRQDVDGAIAAVLTLGQPFRDIDRPLLNVDMRDFVGNYYGMELERLNVAQMLTDFVAILSQHGIRCPGSLMLLIRALVTLEGIGRRLDPSFNLAGHLQPYVERVVQERLQPTRLAERWWRRTQQWMAATGDLPESVAGTLRKLSRDDLQLHLDHRGLDHFTLEVERASNRLVVGLVMSALIVASALLIRASGQAGWFTVPLYVASSLLGMWLIYGIFRSGRL